MDANLVVFDGKDVKEVLTEIKPRRLVISNGKIVYENTSSEAIRV